MKRLIEGVLQYRKTDRSRFGETFEDLADGQEPHTFFITCADSRLVPSLFVAGAPGTLFKHRSVGNILPPSTDGRFSHGDVSEPAALEYAVAVLGVQDIVVCGHSDCGAMKAAIANNVPAELPNLARWIAPTVTLARKNPDLRGPEGMPAHDMLSRHNVLEQIANVRSYDIVSRAEAKGELRLHAWWFDIKTDAIHVWEPDLSGWTLLDEEEAARILAREEAAKG